MKRKIVNLLAKLPGISGYSLYGVLNHPLEAFILQPLREIKYFWQRGRRGYSDRDAWSIDYFLDSFMPQAVRSLKGGHGIPGVLLPNEEPNEAEYKAAYERWQIILEKIARGFESHKAMENFDIEFGTHAWKFAEQDVKEGMKLFIEYYGALWD